MLRKGQQGLVNIVKRAAGLVKVVNKEARFAKCYKKGSKVW